MEAVSLDNSQARPASDSAAAIRTGVDRDSRRAVAPHLWLLTAFWAYVTVSDVLYANSMQASLALMGATNVFASWDARVLQHIFLYPAFVGFIWLSLRVGWKPLWQTLPLQLICGLGFSILTTPALVIGEKLLGGALWRQWPVGAVPTSVQDFFTGPTLPLWYAGVTISLLTYGFGLALVMGFDVYRRLRDSELRSAALERSLSAAHLAALRMQLSPHALFNLLHTIRGQISWDPAAAQSMVVQLGDLLRRLLRAGERDLSRLPDEIALVRLYLELQQRRFSDRLTVSVPSCEQLTAVWVPSLILQPLVENAVVHGLAGHDEAVDIRVEVAVDAETLSLRVTNTIAAGRPVAGADIGLKNVKERLAIQFRDRATFTSGPAAPSLWLAELRIPLLRDVR